MRRLVVCALLVALGCGRAEPAATTARPHPPASDRRPNILFLISDDHSAGDLGAAGNSSIRTPALDRLAADGVRFTSAYAVSPQCSPSRAAIATGRSPHATGTSRLHATLTAEHDTVIDMLKRAGYHVAAFRKVHLGEPFQSHWGPLRRRRGPLRDLLPRAPARSPVLPVGRLPRPAPSLRAPPVGVE